MNNAGENFFTRDRLRDIALGIGRGFQSYDPNNPFAGAGAALEATVGSQLARELRKEQREQREKDLAEIDRRQRDAEARAEQREKDREARADERESERQRREDERTREQREFQREMIGERIEAEKETIRWKAEFDREQEEKERKRQSEMQAAIIDYGQNTSRARADRSYMQDIATVMIGDLPRAKGNSPMPLFRYNDRPVSTPEDKPRKRTRGMMRGPDGRMIKAIEDPDQDTPLFGEGGRDYAY